MADTLTIPANSRHEYYVRSLVEGREIDLLLDTGFTHARCRVGVALDDASYRAIRQRLRDIGRIEIRGFGEGPRVVEGGIGTVALAGLDGSEVETMVVNAGANFLGMCYLHHLTEFSVFWDFAGRLMVITRSGAPA